MALNFNLKQPRLRIHASAKTVLKWQDQKNKFAVLESHSGKTCTILEVKNSDNVGFNMPLACILSSKPVKLTGDFKCILDCPNFQNVCNIDHFRVIKDFRNSIFHDDNEEEPLNRRLRIAAYRSTAFFLRGKLGRGNRIVIPACIKEKIRELCPNPPNIPYEGHSSR